MVNIYIKITNDIKECKAMSKQIMELSEYLLEHITELEKLIAIGNSHNKKEIKRKK